MNSRELSRRLGLWDSVAIVVGTIIGSGVFIVPGSIARELPSGEWMLGIWLAAGALSLCGALAFAELGAMLPHSGGQYVYLREAYSPLWGFLFSWVLLLVVRSGSTATLAVGFSIYLGYFVPLSPLLERLSAAGVILLLTALNYRTLIGGALVQNATTVLKVAGLVLIAGVALGDRAQPAAETATAPSGFGLSEIGVAMIACLWAYNGWFQAGFVGGEIKDPHRNLPISLGAGVGAVVLLYILANVAYMNVLTVEEIAATDRVAAVVAERVFGSAGGTIISVTILISIFGAINAGILTGPRVYFAQGAGRAVLPPVCRGASAFPNSGSGGSAAGRLGGDSLAERLVRRLVFVRDVRRLDLLWPCRVGGDRSSHQAAGMGAAVSHVGLPGDASALHGRFRLAGCQHFDHQTSAVARRPGAHRLWRAGVLLVAARPRRAGLTCHVPASR